MPTRNHFLDNGDDFFIALRGTLMVRNTHVETDSRPLVVKENLRAFIAWLTEEANKIEELDRNRLENRK